MRKLTFLLCFLVYGSANSQTACDSLFYKLDPINVSLNTQHLIVNEILECHFNLGEPDTFSLYDRHYNGILSDNLNAVENIFVDILQQYVVDYPEFESINKLNLLSKNTYRSTLYDFKLDDLPTGNGSDNSNFLDDQMDRLVGNMSESYFLNTFAEIPQTLRDSIEEFAARKIAYMEVGDGDHIYNLASIQVDSSLFIHTRLNTALFDPVFNLTPLFNRYSNFYIETFKDSILTLKNTYIGISNLAYTNNDTAFIKAIDTLGFVVSESYENYRSSVILQFAQYMDTLTLNTELNLADLEYIQSFLQNEIELLDFQEAQIPYEPGPIGAALDHLNTLRRLATMDNLVAAHMQGNIIAQDIAVALASADINDPVVLSKALAIQARDDLTDLNFYVSSYESYKEGLINGNPLQVGLTAGTGSVALLGAGAFFSKSFRAKGASGLKKAFPKGLKNLAKGGIKGYLIELAAKKILTDAVTAPVLNAINALRKEMNARFDIIDEKLDNIIDLQVRSTVAIMDGLQANREFMQFNFNNINFQLDQIIENQNQIQSDLQNLLLTSTGFNHCKSNFEIINEINPISKYSDLELAYANSLTLPSCLNGLTDALVNQVNCANIAFFRAYDTGSEYALQEVENFKKIATLFKFIYGPGQNNRLTDVTQLLLVQSDHTLDNQWDLRMLLNRGHDFGLDPAVVLDNGNYIDAVSLGTIMNYYETFMPFYEVFTTSSDLSPLPLDSYFQLSLLAKAFRIAFVSLYTDNLLCVSKIARAQQALMSGSLVIYPMYKILYDDAYQNAAVSYNGQTYDLRRFCIDVLKNNALLASNFATLVLRKNYGNQYYDTSKIILNGNFSSGNIAFSNDLTFENPHILGGSYAVVDNISEWFAGIQELVDVTGDSDKEYLACDPLGTGNDIVWRQTVQLGPSQNYDFSFWSAEVSTSGPLPIYEVRITNADSAITDTLLVGSTTDHQNWQKYTTQYTSQNTGDYTIEIVDKQTTGSSNNLVIDEIHMIPNTDQLVVNSNFSDSLVGFNSGLNYVDPYDSSTDAYAVVDNANTWWSSLDITRDASGDSSNLFLVTKPPGSGNDTLWSQYIQLDSLSKYDLSFWGAEGWTSGDFPEFELRVIDTTSNTTDTIMTGSITMYRKWQEFKSCYIPTHSGSYLVQIIDVQISAFGNNPLLDNISILKSHKLNPDELRNYQNSFWFKRPFDVFTDTFRLEEMSSLDLIDFSTINDPAEDIDINFLKFKLNLAECTSIPGIACEASILIPPASNLINDRFGYTESYATLNDISARITNLHVNVNIPTYYPTDNWLESMLAKSIIVNQSNQ